MLILGIILFFLGILLYLYVKHNISKPRSIRPMAFDNLLFQNISTLLWIILLISGIVIIFLSDIYIGLILLTIIVLFIILFGFVGNDFSIIKTNYEVYLNFKNKFPNESEEYYLALVAKSRYPNKSTQEIMNIIGASNNIDQLIENIIFFDKPNYYMNSDQYLAFNKKFLKLKKKALKKLKTNIIH